MICIRVCGQLRIRVRRAHVHINVHVRMGIWLQAEIEAVEESMQRKVLQRRQLEHMAKRLKNNQARRAARVWVGARDAAGRSSLTVT